MVNPVGSTLAGLHVHSTKVNTPAHNVANANTAEFKKGPVTIRSFVLFSPI